MAYYSISRNYRLSTLLAWVSLALSACGGGGGGSDSKPPEAAPTVLSTVPVMGATNVALSTKVLTVGFSKFMDASSVSPTTFKLTCPGNVAINGAVSYTTLASLATLTLSATEMLPASSTCTARITQGAKDSTGLALAAEYVWTFNTVAPSESIPPTVTGTANANGAVNVPFNTKVSANFSEPMNPATINANTIVVVEATTGTKVAGTVTYTGVTAVLQPNAALNPSTTYIVTVKGGAAGVTDVAGNPLTNDFVYSWTTGATPDTIAPTVTNTLQVNGGSNVAVNTKAGATFSESMDPLTFTSANFILSLGATPIAGTIQYTGVNAVFVPSTQLAPSSQYTMTLKGGSGGVTDLAGNPLAQDFVIRWTTSASADTVAPIVLVTNYANGSTNVGINTRVAMSFSEAMDPQTVTNNNFVLTTGSTRVAGTVNYAGTQAVFVPLINLLPGTRYTATVKGGTGGVADLAGNRLVADFVVNWTTGPAADLTPPTVLTTLADNGGVGVPINTKVGVLFSEPLDPLTITNNNFRLVSGATNIPGTLYPIGETVVFLPQNNLAPNTTYTVTIEGGPGDVTDRVGNPLAVNYIYSFKTSATTDTTAPVVLASTQATGATNVALSARPGLTLSESIDPLTATTANFLVLDGITPVQGFVSYSGISLVFTPNTLLKPNTLYTVTLKGNLGGISDLSGNAMNDDFIISWTTGTAN
ncbi:MAG: Ig-like domain-containing protein [Candidatus Saccharibacteria bacterium]|nr:Ig-like domain-containing protein [Rhodoferax sp.]